MPKHQYVCYTLSGKGRKTYVGVTNDMKHRLRQHNREIKGGAKATRSGGPWRFAYIVECADKHQALSFEWYMHKWCNGKFRGGGLEKRLKKLRVLTTLPKFNKLKVKSLGGSITFKGNKKIRSLI